MYAARARECGVIYAHHIDGFCAYWQNLTNRRFAAANWKCERCGRDGKLEGHHLHYETLGFEELEDIRARCRQCHQLEPRF